MSQLAGIYELMQDLGDALTSDAKINMLGGGNPAHIEPMLACFREAMYDLLNNANDFEKMVGDYDPPKGNPAFCESLAQLLNKHLNLGINENNIAITNGSQATFSALFQILMHNRAQNDHILLPLVPEYIGYKDIRVNNENIFKAVAPVIEMMDDALFFKYRINFDALQITENTRAICLSRPTNPSGNVVDNTSLHKLAKMAKSNNVPLIIDSAYGQPFPDILFTDADVYWDDNTILCLSLSKLGLPGTRTGIVIANENIVKQISNYNATHALAPGSLGPALMQQILQKHDLIALCQKYVKPYYNQRAHKAIELIRDFSGDVPIKLHQAQGALFLWLWCQDLPVSSQDLYEILKQKNVLVLSGHHFYPGLNQSSAINQHEARIQQQQHECLRISYAASDEQLEKGLAIMAQTLRQIYSQ